MVGAMQEKGQGNGVISELIDFVNRAEQIGNYPVNTAGGHKAALRVVSQVLTDEESTSIDTFREHLEQIFQRVFNKNKKISPGSLHVYQRRINSVMSDYENYGRTPQAMAAWKRKSRATQSQKVEKKEVGEQVQQVEKGVPFAESMHREGVAMIQVEVPVRPNAKAILLVPSDLTSNECERLETFLRASVTNTKK